MHSSLSLSSPSSKSFVSPKIEIREIDGKGKGVIAVAPILRGTLLVREPPAMSIADDNRSEDIASIKRSPEKLDMLMSFPEMQNFTPLAPLLGRLAHFLPMGSSRRGLFPTICRANHACIPNAMYTWIEERSSEELYAIVDVSEGAEVEVSYTLLEFFTLDDFKVGRKYSSKVESSYGFTCRCKLCSKPDPLRRESERRLAEYGKFTIQLPDRVIGLSKMSARDLIRNIDRQCIVIGEEGHPYEISFRCYDAFQLCAFYEDEISARDWIVLQRDIEVVCHGEDSQQVRESDERLKNIRGFHQWGILGKYKLNGPSESLRVHAAVIRLTKEQKLSRCNNAQCKNHTGNVTLKKCSRCKKVAYCSTECQKMDWGIEGHKRLCKV